MTKVPSGTLEPQLKRSLGLPLLVLYGLGVTVGAGIYVLVGVAAGIAGLYAPSGFVLAAFLVSFSALSFAEFSSRYPVSAGEAAYVRAGLGLHWAGTLVGLLVIVSASISAATISNGAVGYLRQFLDVPPLFLLPGVVVLMGLVAGLGTRLSVGFAATLTVIEIGGLLAIMAGAVINRPDIWGRLAETLPPLADVAVWPPLLATSLIAFFAFIGFEDMVNVAEETRDPETTMPRAILLALGIVTILYLAVVTISVLVVPPGQLAASEAPLAAVFAATTGLAPAWISAIAILATLNGVIILIIMAARVVYGLAKTGGLPAPLGAVNRHTHTPLRATVIVTLAILALGLSFDLTALAQWTSRATLLIFALVNFALLRLKWRQSQSRRAAFEVPIVVPLLGFLLSIAAQFFAV